MRPEAHISIPEAQLAELCREHGIRKLSLFGSVLTEDFRPESDVDILVEFEPGTRIGYLGMARLQRKLTELLGREVDLRTPAEISPYFRDDVVDEAEVLYAADNENDEGDEIQQAWRVEAARRAAEMRSGQHVGVSLEEALVALRGIVESRESCRS